MTIYETSQPQMWTARPDAEQSDRIYLDSFGPVVGLRYSHGATGPKSMSCSLYVDPDFTHRALSPGRDCGVTAGGEDVWMGSLSDPVLGGDGSRQLVGMGDSVLPAGFVALGLASSGNALQINEVIDATRLSGRHGRLRRVSDLPLPTGGYAPAASLMMDEALTQVASAQSKQWRVCRDRAIRFFDAINGDGVEYVLRARHELDRSSSALANRLVGAYQDALTGLYSVEHWDGPYGERGGTYYPSFYKADLSGYSSRNFTVYSDGTNTYAYVMSKPATAAIMVLSNGVTLYLQATSQFFSRWVGVGASAYGAEGLTADYQTAGAVFISSGTQDGYVHRGQGSLYATEFIAPVEQVVDLTQNGSYTLPEALTALAGALAKKKDQPHYTGSLSVAPGDLTNAGGVVIDLASVEALCRVTVLVIDPAKSLTAAADSQKITMGEVEYDVDTGVLQMTPLEVADPTQPERFIDPLTGLYR